MAELWLEIDDFVNLTAVLGIKYFFRVYIASFKHLEVCRSLNSYANPRLRVGFT